MENVEVTIEAIIKKQKENYRKSDSKLIKKAYDFVEKDTNKRLKWLLLNLRKVYYYEHT